MKKLPPKCPCCKKRLFEVIENDYKTYVFDSASETYREHELKGETEIFCPHCDTKIFEVFPDGVCNYVPKEGNKSRSVKNTVKKQVM